VRWRAWLAAACAALLCGCSAVQLAYRNADTFLRYQANSYFDFEGALADELDGRIAGFLAWHRAQALPGYVKVLEEAAARGGRPLSRQDLVWGYDAVQAQVREGLRAAAAEAAPLLDRLEPAQVAHLERRLAEDNRKFARDFLSGSPEDRRKRRLKRNIERLEDWVGQLSDAQLERVRQYSDRAPATGAMRDRDRKRRQAELLAMLRAKEAGRRLADWAVHWDAGRAPDYAAASRELREAYFDLLLDLDRTLTPEQRAHAVRRLRGYAADFAELARTGGAKAPAK